MVSSIVNCKWSLKHRTINFFLLFTVQHLKVMTKIITQKLWYSNILDLVCVWKNRSTCFWRCWPLRAVYLQLHDTKYKQSNQFVVTIQIGQQLRRVDEGAKRMTQNFERRKLWIQNGSSNGINPPKKHKMKWSANRLGQASQNHSNSTFSRIWPTVIFLFPTL